MLGTQLFPTELMIAGALLMSTVGSTMDLGKLSLFILVSRLSTDNGILASGAALLAAPENHLFCGGRKRFTLTISISIKSKPGITLTTVPGSISMRQPPFLEVAVLATLPAPLAAPACVEMLGLIIESICLPRDHIS